MATAEKKERQSAPGFEFVNLSGPARTQKKIAKTLVRSHVTKVQHHRTKLAEAAETSAHMPQSHCKAKLKECPGPNAGFLDESSLADSVKENEVNLRSHTSKPEDLLAQYRACPISPVDPGPMTFPPSTLQEESNICDTRNNTIGTDSDSSGSPTRAIAQGFQEPCIIPPIVGTADLPLPLLGHLKWRCSRYSPNPAFPCSEVFLSAEELAEHHTSRHLYFKCELCGRFDRAQYHEEHALRHYQGLFAREECLQCGDRFDPSTSHECSDQSSLTWDDISPLVEGLCISFRGSQDSDRSLGIDGNGEGKGEGSRVV